MKWFCYSSLFSLRFNLGFFLMKYEYNTTIILSYLFLNKDIAKELKRIIFIKQTTDIRQLKTSMFVECFILLELKSDIKLLPCDK